MKNSSDLQTELSSVLDGEVVSDSKTLNLYSRDTSLFSMTPSLVVFPKHTQDVISAVRLIKEKKESGEDVSITARAGGTDMTGGPLTKSVSLVFTKHMNHMFDVSDDSASAEPGIYYRDFEKATLRKGLILPSYPASREICALGGMLANDSGGELTLKYGKTHDYVKELDVILSDGSLITTKPLSEEELEKKKELETLEGKIYRDIHKLLADNAEIITRAKPRVSKNSAGYALWEVENKQKKTFDLSQLIIGSQGTLGLITRARLNLVPRKTHKSMLVIFLSDLNQLPEVVKRVLAHNPESFESYDDKTYALAVRFFFQFVRQMGLKNMFNLGLAFIPEVFMAATGGIPKLVLMAEFSEDSDEKADENAQAAQSALQDMDLKTRIAPRGMQTEKYWIIRRESFALLRKNVDGLYAAPFIDDIVIPTDAYPSFLPRLTKILEDSGLIYTIAGHIGDGNLHIIPLVDLTNKDTKDLILDLTTKIYGLVSTYDGSITGEHNDGIIRTPYLPLMYGDRVVGLFKEVKNLFDPLNILNPNKKVGGTEADISKYMINHA